MDILRVEKKKAYLCKSVSRKDSGDLYLPWTKAHTGTENKNIYIGIDIDLYLKMSIFALDQSPHRNWKNGAISIFISVAWKCMFPDFKMPITASWWEALTNIVYFDSVDDYLEHEAEVEVDASFIQTKHVLIYQMWTIGYFSVQMLSIGYFSVQMPSIGYFSFTWFPSFWILQF